MADVTRRGFLALSGAAGLSVLLSPATASATDRAVRDSVARAVNPAGTTLQAMSAPVNPGPRYTRLTEGPGLPLVVRRELNAGKDGRDDRRVALASFVQFTDLHITDAESPVRFEYLHPLAGAFHRPHETLGPVSATSLVRRVNALAGGPFTGRPLDFMMSTGDNTDNHELVELNWFLDILNGGVITASTGDPGRYEGVQDSGSAQYWNPAMALDDAYTNKGFPQIPGLLDAAVRRFPSPGLNIPWYCTIGNHDDSVVGAFPGGIPGLKNFYTGDRKVIGQDPALVAKLMDAVKNGTTLPLVELLTGASGTVRRVTPDPRRAPFDTGEFVRAHLDWSNTGPGPYGHGFTAGNADGRRVYYTFSVAPGITGISLDSTNLAGFADGSIGQEQFTWLEGVLRSGTGDLFVVFSHHTSDTMDNLLPDPRAPLEKRLNGAALVSLLEKSPNVLAWVNGHRHLNKIIPHQGFWEINTASHIDYPQQARIIEIVDNRDGTLSLFTTLVESDAPYAVDYDDTSPPALASLYRELSYNDLHADPVRTGAGPDQNTELLLPNPLR